MAKKKTLQKAQRVYERYPTRELHLDTLNPRMVEFGTGSDTPEFDIIKVLWEKMAVAELAMSIAYNGYFEHEPLFLAVRPEGGWTVIEGNRRLAAIKILLDGELRRRLKATDLPTITTARRSELQSLPGVVTKAEDIWRYLGFKHVNGPATWGSYAKAQYIATVHNDYKVPLEQIAQQIGDYANTVERMYRGLMVIEQAEEAGVFNRANTSKPSFFFNYIYTALDNVNFRKFLGLDDVDRQKRRPVPGGKIKDLGDLCRWLYGDITKDATSLIRSQNPDLGRLGALLADPEGVQALRDGYSLDTAEDISAGDESVFRRSLQEAKQALSRAHGTLSLGFDPKEEGTYRIAEEVDQLASELVEEMEEKRRRQRRQKRRKPAT